MFRPLLGHLQALWKNISKSCLYFNALWDPKCLQTVLYECKIHKNKGHTNSNIYKLMYLIFI